MMDLNLKNPALMRKVVPIGERWIEASGGGTQVENPATGSIRYSP